MEITIKQNGMRAVKDYRKWGGVNGKLGYKTQFYGYEWLKRYTARLPKKKTISNELVSIKKQNSFESVDCGKDRMTYRTLILDSLVS